MLALRAVNSDMQKSIRLSLAIMVVFLVPGCIPIFLNRPITVISVDKVHNRKSDIAITKSICDAVAARHRMEIVNVNWGSDQVQTYNRVKRGLFGESLRPPSIILNYDIHDHPDSIGLIIGGGAGYDGGRRAVVGDILPVLQSHFGKRVTWSNDTWTEF